MPLPAAEFFAALVVIQTRVDRGVRRDVIPYRHYKTRIFLSDIHTPFHLAVYILFCAREQHTSIGVADEAVGFSVFFGDVSHIGEGFEHKPVHADIGDIVDKFGIAPVGSEQYLFAPHADARSSVCNSEIYICGTIQVL